MPNRLMKPGRIARAVEPAQLYRQMADALPHMLWTAQPDGTVEYLNARVLEYTGMKAQHLKGWGWGPIYHPDDLDLCVRRWKRALASGKGFDAEYRLRRFDGEYRWHFHTVLALRDTQGRIVKWFGTCTDIEEQKNTVRLLQQARQTLESLIVARSQTMEEGQDGDRRLERLSARERQVLQLIVDGHTSSEVGERLGLSPKSIDTYRSRLMAKLGIEDLPSLVKFALRHGLTTIE